MILSIRMVLLVAFSWIAVPAAAQDLSTEQIYKQLAQPPAAEFRSGKPLTVDQLKRRRDVRIAIPSVDINTINFAFDSAAVPASQRWKLRNLAAAMRRFLRHRPFEVFLLEGHTDAVGSRAYNLALSRRRAAGVRRTLIDYFRVPPHALETVGYGEDYLLIPTGRAEWRNRRVTVRRITDVIRPQY
ncbi:MAG TPA: OmpA family protein [Afifellaceae bacterium]|nr:OmpA family protein [Afifellaceae bacterium]